MTEQAKSFVVKGHFCHSASPDQIEVVEGAYAVVESGVCRGLFRALPEQYHTLPIADFTDKLIVPGMCDLHTHAPQFSFRGLGMDMELLDWLNTYTFPEEAKYCDLSYADRAYDIFTEQLRKSATTRAVVFGTIHTPATELLMQKLERTGLHSYVGKVSMDRNAPPELCESNAEQAAVAIENWIERVQNRFIHTHPILTPRFIPSCSEELMHKLGVIREKYNLPVQSHLSENVGEISWVKELCPNAAFYGKAYDDVGLFGGNHKCIMAHCVHSSADELALMKKNNVFIAHCPESNVNLASGIAPIAYYMKLGLHVGLATDLAAGSCENMFRAITQAIQISKLQWRLLDETMRPLTVDQAFFLATRGGGDFFGKVGCFSAGYEFDAIVLDDSTLPHPQELSVRARLERMLYLADERNITAKYIAGKRIAL